MGYVKLLLLGVGVGTACGDPGSSTEPASRVAASLTTADDAAVPSLPIGSEAFHGPRWVDVHGATIYAISSQFVTNPPLPPILYVADSNGIVWVANPDGTPSEVYDTGLWYTSSDCTGTGYLDASAGTPGPRMSFAINLSTDGGTEIAYYTVSDKPSVVTLTFGSTVNGICNVTSGTGPFVLPVPVTRPKRLFDAPAHPVFAP